MHLSSVSQIKRKGVTPLHMEEKIPKSKEAHLLSENTDDGMIDTNISWLGFKTLKKEIPLEMQTEKIIIFKGENSGWSQSSPQ